MANPDEKTGVRLQQFLSAENITQAQFADSLGITRASISHILAGRNKPSFDFFYGITQRYPNLNLEWLVCGKGRMYKTPGAELFASETIEKPSPDQPLPEFQSQSGLAANPTPDSGFTSDPEPATAPNSLPRTGDGGNTQFSDGFSVPVNTPQKPVNQRRISKLVVFYDDGTYKELK